MFSILINHHPGLASQTRAFSSSLRRVQVQVGRKPMKLPRLPVPDLRRTLDKYVESLKPFLQEDEAAGGMSYEAALQQRVQWAREFEEGVGALAQQRLHELDKLSPHNWLDDNIWLKKAYLESRDPLPVNSNWWLAFFNDSTVPKDVLRCKSRLCEDINPHQIRRAAWIVHRLLDFKDRLARQELYPDTTRAGVWFRTAIAKMYGVCRIPQVGCDTISAPPPSSAPDARQIIVLIYNWLYAVEVYDDAWNLIAPQELENRLRRVAADVTYRQKCGERAIPVGVLSADDRDSWAENLQYLLSLSPVNVRTFDTVQHSIFALSLDDWTYGATSESRSTPSIPRVNSAIEINNHLQNIRSSLDARNRWFDKALTVIVETNTRAGAMGEHSPLDALIPSIAAEYAIVTDIDRSAFANPNPEDTSFDRDSEVGWERLDWVTDALIERKCGRARERAEEVIADSDDAVMWFSEYGGDWIRDAARLPPDAYVQMALQLAWYRTRGFFTATYETALTRLFEHGRTETIRTLTSDSRAWVLAMVDPSTPLQKRLALLRRAVQTHTRLTREAAVGKGIDRHLMGLLCMLRPSEGEFSALFEDELFTRSQMWKLSTSGLSTGPLFRGTGFGSPYHDGYGINYLTGPDMIKFGVESKHGCPLTSTAIFQAAIKDALRDMRVIFTQDLSHSDNPEMARL